MSRRLTGSSVVAGDGVPPAAAGTITIKGSDTMGILTQRWAEEFMKKNPGTRVQVTGGGSGVGFAALQMKKAVVGHGLAAKSQIQQMVQRLLALQALPGRDAADALGLAITHAHAAGSFAAMAAATP